MDIVYLGHSSFLLRTKNTNIVTDPFNETMVGYKFPKVEAKIVTVSHSHEDHHQSDAVEGSPFVISAPGEYEIADVSIFGIATYHDAEGGSQRGQNISFLIETDGLKICHLGDLGHKLNDKQLEELSQVDVLLIPVGGVDTLGAKEAVEVVTQIEPRIVIPMHYRLPKSNPQFFSQFAEVNEFLKAMGVQSVIPQVKLSINKESLPEQTQVIVLEAKSG